MFSSLNLLFSDVPVAVVVVVLLNTPINNGNRTERSSIRTIIIRVITKAPSTLICFQTKTELFRSVFKKICVHTYRFRIVFTHPHYNAVSVLKTLYTLSAHVRMNSTHAHFNISAREIGAKLKLHGSVCPPFWILTVEWPGARSFRF